MYRVVLGNSESDTKNFFEGIYMESDTKSFFRADQSKNHSVCYTSSGIFILDLIFFRAWVSTLPREDVFSCLVPASLGR